jgi:hypothetical protein
MLPEFFEAGCWCIAQAIQELTIAQANLVILLPQPPECWDYRYAPTMPCLNHSFFISENEDINILA